MFTGIITNIGVINDISYHQNQDSLIAIELINQAARNFEIGCSIACNGVCLTLVKQVVSHKSLVVSLQFQASPETLNKTNIKNWKIGDKINLEFALRMGDELGGHLVAGHIDNVVKVLKIESVNNDSWRFEFELPKDLKKFMTPKGSAVLNGVSLTVNEVLQDSFSVNIIKHTFDNTNFNDLKIGDSINLEVDLIARYLEKLIIN